MRKYIVVDVPERPKKSKLQLKVERLINKAEKQGYEFKEIELGIFAALGRANWDEEKVNWLVLELFEKMYLRFYPSK